MKRKFGFALVAVFALLVGIWWWRPTSQPSSSKLSGEHRVTPPETGRSQSASVPRAVQTAIPQPRLFKATRHPPQTPEEKAMWEWWTAMDKADPKFQWKMPMEFYGKVVVIER